MTIGDALARIRTILIAPMPGGSSPPPVVRTVGEELARLVGAELREEPMPTPDAGAGTEPAPEPASGLPGTPGSGVALGPGSFVVGVEAEAVDGVTLELKEDGSGRLVAGRPRYLYSFLTHLLRELPEEKLESVRKGKVFRPAFSWNRPTYDFFLTQEGRSQRGLDRQGYVRRLAESGFTHLEVNGLAFHTALETGPEGEAYPMFYTYCPALDQFVESDPGAGLYPADYLEANLRYLQENAELARKYGLVPGLLSFEPRSVPEAFFRRYPMLRGARVDHPFRSFKPRYNMTIAHPLVREHYAQMLRRLMERVPELGFFSIWTNDSGAGFEHTQSLYVGRNGGAYLIREWKDQDEIARAAGDNALRFLRTLRDAGRERNPDFRVLTRMESFYGEHEVIRGGLEEGLEVETASLAARGWAMPYNHPRYPDSSAFPAGSVYQRSFHPDEGTAAEELEGRGSHAHFYFASGPWALFAPLVGIPYPVLTVERLRLLHANGVRHLAHMGGTHPPHLVPFNVNHEVLRAFQFDPEMELEPTLRRLAARWTGEDGGTSTDLADTLLDAWARAEEAILAFPHVTPLYSLYGFVWYRLWARPLVPNIEAIPLKERACYQDYMCTTPHNPNNVDLSRDVLFRLTTVPECRKAVERMDAHVWTPLDEAVSLLAGAEEDARGALGEENVLHDQRVRLAALRCWMRTQRSVAAWVAGVGGYMEAGSEEEKQHCRLVVREMVGGEVANSRELLGLLEEGVEFMATTDKGETPLIHGRNLGALLTKRIRLMEAHRDDEPFIDPDYMMRQAGRPV